jgi:2-polyprenyl-3-methyl-5-hydroxy-6-metoxy-1,4-benzoquinol methylase/glycosyltransferase involved in cell wall biosynthesis
MTETTEPTAPERTQGLPYIGLSLIALNEEKNLPKLLESFGVLTAGDVSYKKLSADKEYSASVDCVVVCDTGSTDFTKEIAAAYSTPECPVIVVDFKWCNDFSAARQYAWDALPEWCEFGVWADCDDTVRGATGLRTLAAQMPPVVSGSLHPYEYARDEAGNVACYLERERLVRLRQGEHWKLPVHEILALPGQYIRNEDIVWVHGKQQAVNGERNFKILKADYAAAKKRGDDPDPRTIVYLGSEALGLGKLPTAIKHLKEYLAVGAFDEELCQAAHKLSIAYRAQTADHRNEPAKFDALLEKSREAAFLAITHRPDWADGYLDLAEISALEEKWQNCIRWADLAADRGAPSTLLITNPLDYVYQPLLLKSAALTHLGKLEEAMECTQKALAVTPYRDDLQGQMGGLASRLKVNETVKHVLAVRELLVRHDENLKADQLLKNVPYYVEDHPLIAQARLDQREMVLHAVDPTVYRDYYGDNPNEAFFEQHGIDIAEAHTRFYRLAFLRDGLAAEAKRRGKRGLKVLDFSGNDGWMAANLSLAGHHVDMMDLNAEAVKRADARRGEYPGIGKVVCDDLHRAPEHFDVGSYDAVIMFETIEHVPDPRASINVMATMCKPTGRCYISTPDGAYEHGNVPNWAEVEHKGHLRAITPHDLLGWICEQGIAENFVIGPDRVQIAVMRPSVRKGKVVFYAGMTDPKPESILGDGQGGSETALVKMAELFARRGYDVRVFAGEQGIGIRGDQISIDGQDELQGQVLYGGVNDWDPGDPCDLFISSRCPEVLDRSIASPNRVLWLHDATYADRLTEARAKRATSIVVLSRFQKELLREEYPFLAPGASCSDRVFVSRNGIETRWYEKAPQQKKPWVVYSSSPDRGLDVLLKLWPRIKEQVPQAELHHTYAPVYKQFAAHYAHLAELSERIAKLSEAQGVVVHDSMGQKELAELFLKARVWAYPSFNSPGKVLFPEISCISAMEAQAGGCVPVFTEYGALTETVVGGIPVSVRRTADGTALSKKWEDHFVSAVVTALTSKAVQAKAKRDGREHALQLGWEGVADEWEAKFLDHVLPPSMLPVERGAVLDRGR